MVVPPWVCRTGWWDPFSPVHLMYGAECSSRNPDLAGLPRADWELHPDGGDGNQIKQFKGSEKLT